MSGQAIFRMTALAAMLAAAIACVETKQTSPTSPSSSTTTGSSTTPVSGVLTQGAWASATVANAATFSPNTCGNFKWQITTLTATSATGTFSASCGGGLNLQGSAEGKLEGLTGTITASGTGSSPTITSCTFLITAVAVPNTPDTVKLTYSGNVCGMTTSGTEILKRP